MKFTTQILSVIVLASVWVVFSGTTTDSWELKKNKDGIAIYTKMVSGSAFKSVKINTTIKGSLSSVIALLTDISVYPQWVYNCKQASILKQINPKEYYRYQITSAPWPVDNRDLITHITIIQDAVTKVIHYDGKAAPDYLALKNGMVRVRKMNENWVLTPKANGIIEISDELTTDPGGNIPTSLINTFIEDGPYQSMQNFKAFIQHPKYEKAKLSFIKD